MVLMQQITGTVLPIKHVLDELQAGQTARAQK